ncbi:MAG: hypothetical protein MEQ84_13055 [Mesorhizobium sp.]|nr:hypothetical protein [Mesorhizobium sp.]
MAHSPANSQYIDPQTVSGWGVDADTDNDPTYPYRERISEDQRTMNWERPTLQQFDVEILASVEHNRVPATNGSAYPPRGLSGMMRRQAFSYSESDWRHWLVLLAADRINMAEVLLWDLSRGRVPNIPQEMGIRAELRHNKAGLAKKAVVVAGVSILLIAVLRRR